MTVIMEETSLFLVEASKLLANLKKKQKSTIDTISLSVRETSSEFINLDDNKYLCKWCSNPWSDGRFSFRIRAENVPRWVKLSLKNNSQCKSSYKNRILNSYKSKIGNLMIMHCKICNKITKIRTEKPTNNFKKDEDEIELRSNDQEIESKKKKKKRKKDIYAGLKIGKMLEKSNEKLEIKNPNFIVSNVEENDDNVKKLELEDINENLNNSLETKENYTSLEENVHSTLNKPIENTLNMGISEQYKTNQANSLVKKPSIKKNKNYLTNNHDSSNNKNSEKYVQNLKPILNLQKNNKLMQKKKNKLQLLKKVSKLQTSDLKDFISSL